MLSAYLSLNKPLPAGLAPPGMSSWSLSLPSLCSSQSRAPEVALLFESFISTFAAPNSHVPHGEVVHGHNPS